MFQLGNFVYVPINPFDTLICERTSPMLSLSPEKVLTQHSLKIYCSVNKWNFLEWLHNVVQDKLVIPLFHSESAERSYERENNHDMKAEQVWLPRIQDWIFHKCWISGLDHHLLSRLRSSEHSVGWDLCIPVIHWFYSRRCLPNPHYHHVKIFSESSLGSISSESSDQR
jgi:hypothetical protein